MEGSNLELGISKNPLPNRELRLSGNMILSHSPTTSWKFMARHLLMSFWGQPRVPSRSQTWCWKSITVNPRPRMPVATRTIAFLVGDPYQPSLFHWNPGWKADPRCIYIYICISLIEKLEISCSFVDWRLFCSPHGAFDFGDQNRYSGRTVDG